MAQFETWLESDLKKPNKVKMLKGDLFSQDSKANLIGVIVTDGGEPVTLSGTIQGIVVRSDNGYKTVTGQKSGNRAWIELPAEAYEVVGHIQVVIRLISGTDKVVLGGCIGYVTRSTTNSPIIPSGQVVPDIDQFLEYIDEMLSGTEAATEAAEAANEAAAKIDGMTVSAATSETPSATISEVDGHKHIAFGLVKGDKGDPGTNATVVGQNTAYQAGTSGSIAPTGQWLDVQPDVPQGQYLWVRNTVSWSTGQTTVIYTVARQGMDGSGSVSAVMGISPDQNGNVASLPDYQGATASANGVHGLVPAAQSGERGYFLRGDGVWDSPSGTTYNDATTEVHGLMSAADKAKLDSVNPAIDDELDDESQNPVENQAIVAALAGKAALNSPALTGTPTAPTPATGDSSQKIATTAFVGYTALAERPLCFSIEIYATDWETESAGYSFTYENAEILSSMAIIGVNFGDSQSEGNLVSGLMLTASTGQITVETAELPVDTVTLTVSVQKANGPILPVYIAPRMGGGDEPYNAHDQLIINTEALGNYNENVNFIAIFDDQVAVIFDGRFDQDTISAFASAPSGYEPFSAESFTAYTWYNGTKNTNALTLGKDGIARLGSIACERIQFFGLYPRKLPVMHGEFFQTATSGGPTMMQYTTNSIVADTVAGTVTYSLDVTCSQFTVPSSNPAFGLYMPDGYGPLSQTKGHTILRLSDGTTVEDSSSQYLYIARGGNMLLASFSGLSVTGFLFQATGKLYDENKAEFTVNANTLVNATVTANQMTYDPDAGTLHYEFAATFNARYLTNSLALMYNYAGSTFAAPSTFTATITHSNGDTEDITLRYYAQQNYILLATTATYSDVTGLAFDVTFE